MGTYRDLRFAGAKIAAMTSGGCRNWRANGQRTAPIGVRYSGREMPSFFIFQYNIDRFMPRRARLLGDRRGSSSFRAARR